MSKIVYYLTPSSFCYGVEKAVNELSDILTKHPGEKVFCVHALVHNPKITQGFEEKGVTFVESPDEIADKDAVVVFSAHGINRVVLEDAKKKFRTVYNLECPFVTKIYREADAAFQQGISTFFYIGKEHHQEKKNVVEYIQSRGGTVYVFPNSTKIPAIDPTLPLAVLSQTTMNFAEVSKILESIKTKYPHAQQSLLTDICRATYERQAIVSSNLDKFDAFVVIGGQESSNSKELYDIGVQNNKKTFYGESFDDIVKYPKEELFACDRVAVTGGASTPAEDIKAVFDFYRDNGYEPRILNLQ